MQNRDDSQRNLNGQETADDHDEHQRGAVGIAQFAAFARFAILFEEFVSFLLGSTQSAEQ